MLKHRVFGAALLTVGLVCTSMAQIANPKDEGTTFESGCKELKNTYQVIVLNKRIYSLPYNLCEIITDNRHETKEVRHKLSPFIHVRILPKSVIEKGNLEELEEVKFEAP